MAFGDQKKKTFTNTTPPPKFTKIYRILLFSNYKIFFYSTILQLVCLLEIVKSSKMNERRVLTRYLYIWIKR